VRHFVLSIVFAIVFVCAAAPIAAAQDKTVERGEKVFAVQKCSMCHSIAGKGNAKGALDDVGAKRSDEEIRQWLIAPRVMSEKTKSTRKPLMPEYTKLSKEDLDGLIAYLKTRKKA